MYSNPKLVQKKITPVIVEEETDVLEPMAQIQSICDYVGYSTYLVPKDEESKIDQLYISFKTEQDNDDDEDLEIEDNADEEWQEDGDTSELPMIHLMFLNDIADTADSEDKSENDSYTLQFFISLENKAETTKLTKLYEHLNNINQFLPIGHFGWKHDEGLYYKYCLMLGDKNIDSILLIETIELITFIFQKFSPDLLKILNGEEVEGQIKLFN